MTTRPRIGGWTTINVGHGIGINGRPGRPIDVTVSRTVFRYRSNPMDNILGGGGARIEDGTEVRITRLHGAPPGTMGSYHIADPDTGELLGLVSGSALEAI